MMKSCDMKRHKLLMKLYSILVCCFLCITSCRSTDEITAYYRMGFVESPVSKSPEEFEKEADNHPVDTVIYIEQEQFDRYCTMISDIRFVHNSSEDRHDYVIDIKCKNINVAMSLPVQDSLDGEVVVYAGQKKHGRISDDILYELLCSVRYFDFFDKEELAYHPLVRKYERPSNYACYYERHNYQGDVPAKVKSRYKVVLKVR